METTIVYWGYIRVIFGHRTEVSATVARSRPDSRVTLDEVLWTSSGLYYGGY